MFARESAVCYLRLCSKHCGPCCLSSMALECREPMRALSKACTSSRTQSLRNTRLGESMETSQGFGLLQSSSGIPWTMLDNVGHRSTLSIPFFEAVRLRFSQTGRFGWSDLERSWSRPVVPVVCRSATSIHFHCFQEKGLQHLAASCSTVVYRFYRPWTP